MAAPEPPQDDAQELVDPTMELPKDGAGQKLVDELPVSERIIGGIEEALAMHGPVEKPEPIKLLARPMPLSEIGFAKMLAERSAQTKADLEESSRLIEQRRLQAERRVTRRWWISTGIGALGLATAIGLGLWNRFDPPTTPATPVVVSTQRTAP